jgi:hypothetical protein
MVKNHDYRIRLHKRLQRKNRFFWIRSNEEPVCPDCGGKLEKKDWVKRIKKNAGGQTEKRMIERRRCTNPNCRKCHRLLPDDQVPFKHYDVGLIERIIDDDLTEEEALAAEDRPCDDTKTRWRAWAVQLVKNAEGQIRSSAHRILDLSDQFLGSRESLLEKIKERIPRGWLGVVLRVMINTGGTGTLPEPS